MKNKDRHFKEITSLCEGAIPFDSGRYHCASVENDNCKIVFWNPIRKSSCLFATIVSGDALYPKIIENITKRKAVRLLKRYGFKVDWDCYNEQIYGEQK